MKENTRIDFFIFLASFCLMLASVLAALNDRLDVVNVLTSFMTWGSLFGVAFMFSWFFRRRQPALCDRTSLALALGVLGFFAFQIFRGTTRSLDLPLVINFIICLQLALSLALKDKREFYLTYFLSFVLILYGAYISVSLFYFFLFAVYFIAGALVLSLETVADFELEKISVPEKKFLFGFFGVIFFLAVSFIIILALGLYTVIPKWSLAPYFNFWDRSPLTGKSDPNFWEQIYGRELTKKLCNQTDLDRLLGRLTKNTSWAKNILEDERALQKVRSQGEINSPASSKPGLSPTAIKPPVKSPEKPPVKSPVKPAKINIPLKNAAPPVSPPTVIKPTAKKAANFWWLLLSGLLTAVIVKYLHGFQLFITRLVPPKKAVIALYRLSLKKMAGRGYHKKPAQTPREFAGSLPDAGYQPDQNPFYRLTGLVEMAFYSGQKIIYTQVTEARKLYREITGIMARKIKKNKNHESRYSS